jgi:hypothetical protein
MACRGFKIQVRDQCGRRSAGAGKRFSGSREPATGRRNGFRGRNPKVEVKEMYTGTMYTGTMIRDLLATVEQAESRAEQRISAERRELHEIFSMQIPVPQSERVFMGAA